MIKLFFTSAPFQIDNTGDCDYMMQFAKTLGKHQIKSEVLPCSDPQLHELYLCSLTKNVANKQLFLKKYAELKHNELRKRSVEFIMNYVKKDKSKIKVLCLQLRAPESGFLFYPEDLMELRKNKIYVVATCHEFYLNVYRDYLKKITLDMLNCCHLTFFFNEIDYKEAYKTGFRGKYEFTKQIVTVPIKRLENTVKRPKNILFFGLIRPKKGLESALKLAEIINGSIGKVIIIGKCESNNPLIRRYLENLNNKLITKDFEVKPEYRHILEIHINPDDEKLTKIINSCRYAYKPDGKGFANNSSSIINLLAFGCIVYTKWGPYTPSFVTDKRSKYYGALRLQNQMNSDILKNDKPAPIDVYNDIINSDEEKDMKSVYAAKLLLKDVYNNDRVTIEYYRNILLELKKHVKK